MSHEARQLPAWLIFDVRLRSLRFERQIQGKVCPFIPDMTQRDKMRELFGRYHGKHEAVVAAYAAAEDAGEVVRKKNARRISSYDYAERLFADGVRKHWIRER